jgi:hypothetical protein
MSLYEDKQAFKIKVQLKEDNFDDWNLELSVVLLNLEYYTDGAIIVDELAGEGAKVKQEESKDADTMRKEKRRKTAVFTVIFTSISQKMKWLVKNVDVQGRDLEGMWRTIYEHFKETSTRGKIAEMHRYLGTTMGEGESFDKFVENLREGQNKINNMKINGIEITDVFQVFMLTYGVLKCNHHRFHSSVVLLEKQIGKGITFNDAVRELRVVALREEERDKEVIALAVHDKKAKKAQYVTGKFKVEAHCHGWKLRGSCAYEARTGNPCRFQHDEELGKQARDREARKKRNPGGRVIGKKSNGEVTCSTCKGNHLPSACPKAKDQALSVMMEEEEGVGFHPDE